MVKKNDKDETGNILLKYIFTSLLPSTKRGGGCPPLDLPMYLLRGDHLILRGIWKFLFLEINILVMSKKKINILSRNETKRNTAYRRPDNK